MTTEEVATEPSLVITLMTSQAPGPHWIHDCPESKLKWWFPLALTAAIYAVNILYILGKYLLKRLRPEPTPHCTAYPNIFRGIDHNSFDDDDQELDFMEEEPFARSQAFWVDDNQWSDLDDLRTPHTSTIVATTLAVPSEQTVNDEEEEDESFPGRRIKQSEKGIGGEKVKDNGVALQLSNSVNVKTVEEVLQKKNVRHLLRQNRCLGGQNGQLTLKIRIYCEKMTSVSYPTGRFMLVVYVLLCTMSWIIYIIGTIFLYNIETQPDVIKALEGRPPLIVQGLCLTSGLSILNWSDLAIHTYFLIYFILRLGAAVDRNMFFFKITSLVDVLTICGSYVAAFQPRYHLDLGFLRALNVFNFGEVLSYMGILSSNHVIETVDVFFIMFAMWMVGSGLIHLIIHLGDFWEEDHKALQWNYLDCCYFLLVTMSTVGFGDFYPVTMLGRLYICVFIPVAMGIFAVFVPEIFRKVSARGAPSDSYQALAGHQHVVVCGHFNNISLSAVLRGFFHIEHASRHSLVNMVILRVSPIDLAMRAILTKYNAWVKYYQGTPADPQDLARICFRSSQGALVLAKPNSNRSVDEDGGNIMQAISLKAHSERIRVLVQLHHFKNKCLLYNFPRWTCRTKDMVICMDELKLGLMSLNCIAPGFSTIILNLLNGHRIKNVGKQTQKEKWRREYEYGVSMEIYDVSLSYEFHNLCVQELTLFAYEKWNIVICALCRTEADKPSVIINPAGYKDLKVNTLTTKAIVIATNSTVVSRMRNYCTKCRGHETDRLCQCPTRLQFYIQAAGLKKERERAISDDESEFQVPEYGEVLSDPLLIETEDTAQGQVSRSASGDLSPSECDLLPEQATVAAGKLKHSKVEGFSRFTIGPIPTSASPRSGVLTQGCSRQQSLLLNLADYIPLPHKPYVPKYVDSTGCFHWIPDMPIERIKLTPAEAIKYQFRDHYLLCMVEPLADQSLNLRSFVFPLRFHWMEVRDIVILGNTSAIKAEEWTSIKNIPNVFLVQGNPCSLNDLNAVRLKHCTACTILGEAIRESEEDHCLRDKNTLFCAMTIRSLIEQSPRYIHMATELHYEQNAHHFSSAESHKLDFKLPIRFQEAFARGIIFSNTLLYSSISSLYFSGSVFQFLRVLLFGIAVEELESASLLRNGLQRGQRNASQKATGVRVALLNMCEIPFGTLFTRPGKRVLRYKDVFIHALMCWRILCLGIYRLDRRGFRVVITNPPKVLKMCTDDQVFCFIPSESTVLQEDAGSVVSTPTMDSSLFFSRTPGATYAGMSAIELARQSANVLRKLQPRYC
ncbi:Calcium-activated potassium channel subunit alpha-1 [Echinococcus granulosus]|nr:Calcium-activated potassium channel subunit alpha-1 [Echinococcus granulosus]